MSVPGTRRGERPAPVGLERLRVVLCDADDNLFGSEIPAFEAATEVTNRFLAAHGVAHRYTPGELRRAATGMNFRATAVALASAHGVPVAPDVPGAGSAATTGRAPGAPALDAAALEHWVREERRAVTAHLREVLRPDPAVLGPLTAVAAAYEVAAVSSSADARLAACFEVTGMAGFFPAARRFSAEDSLPVPRGKPDPAVYRHALAALGVEAEESLAVEDSVAGVTSAVAAGVPVVGNLQFLRPDERAARHEALLGAGAGAVVASWDEVLDLLPRTRPAQPVPGAR
ncbi:hypothetical protein NUM3379_29930 [Kineococcus sp. NUM-3379]